MKNLTVLLLAGLVLFTPLAALAETSSGAGSGSVSICRMSDSLMEEYNKLILELREKGTDTVRAEEITRKITSLKQEIEKQRGECTETIVPQQVMVDRPTVISVNRCGEVAQWETKIAYYKKLALLSDADLKNESFSREDVEKTLRELMAGAEKVRAQCSTQSNATDAQPVTETVKPVTVESGEEISAYYKEKLERVVSARDGDEKQIADLKTLRNEIDELITKLIKGKKEFGGDELGTLVTEVKVSKGEIKADNVAVEATGKKIFTNMGGSAVSVEPTASQVLILDKGLEVNAKEVTIKENKISVGNIEVKLPASMVAEKLNLTPKSVELREENEKAIYSIKVEESRKLFGFIPLNIEKTVTADAGNGDELGQTLPWYAFLTTK
ncbi:hypothetical protein A2110_00570 [Candidatus Jorgensenbacteria bacterium GWA1_54_12]|uniref:Copper amine oxidase-like N-terminal domain-containing protein n=1 Tax=Candidatus Jorgensenbacteria bacterium GWA1_54_12 TaxID=1798468 RepID=A0A1F6BL93_9BACT|nr:MAG: hypothetical protein A2110_00570 [Candidatus Jorgensenbacteria bacterium GWA1_54_12]